MDTFTTSQKDYQIDAHSEYESKAETRPPKGWAYQSGYENFDHPSARLEVESGGPLERLLTRIEAIDDLQGPFLRHFYEDRVLGAWRDFLVAQKDEAEQLGNQRKEDLTETTQTTSAATTLNSIKSPESENQAISLKSDTPPQDTLPESQASKEGGSEAQDDEPKSAEEQKAEAKTDEVNTPQDDKSKGSASPFRNQLPELNEKRKHLSKQVDDLAGQLSTLQVEFDERRKEAAVAYGKLGQPYILDPTDDPNAESEPEIKPIALLDKFGQLVGWLAGKQYSHSQREAQAQLADAKSAESWASSCHLPYYPRPEIDSQDIPPQFRNLWSMLYDRRSHLPIMSSTASLFVTLGAGLIIGISLGINLGIIQASELASSLTGSSIATFMNKYGVWALLGFAIALATKHLVLLMFTNFGENVGFEY